MQVLKNCPFCNDHGFDAFGLKVHLMHCEAFFDVSQENYEFREPEA
jgi:hypothetical protein